jgi:hypothetical protein
MDAEQSTQQDAGCADAETLADIGFAEKKSGNQRG